MAVLPEDRGSPGFAPLQLREREPSRPGCSRTGRRPSSSAARQGWRASRAFVRRTDRRRTMAHRRRALQSQHDGGVRRRARVYPTSGARRKPIPRPPRHRVPWGHGAQQKGSCASTGSTVCRHQFPRLSSFGDGGWSTSRSSRCACVPWSPT